MTALLLVLIRYVRIGNMPRHPETDAGWQRMYRLTRRMLGWMAVIASLLSWDTALAVIHPGSIPGVVFWILVLLLLGVIGGYVVRVFASRP